jgi:hypothetical protein
VELLRFANRNGESGHISVKQYRPATIDGTPSTPTGNIDGCRDGRLLVMRLEKLKQTRFRTRAGRR